MSRGERWAARFASTVGALLWFAGVIARVPLALLLAGFLDLGLSGKDFIAKLTSGEHLFYLLIGVVGGPLLSAVGGGMRYLAALLAGRKVAGRFAGWIFFYDWLRYEFIATGLVLTFLLVLVAAAYVGLLAAPIGLLVVVVCQHLAGECQLRSEKLMWAVRLENLPPEAALHPMKVLRMSDR